VREEEQKLAKVGDEDLFKVDEAAIDVSQGEEAVQAVRKYDRVCQLLAWLALESKSESRDAQRSAVVERLGPYLEERNIALLPVAQNLWALADSDDGLNLESLGSQTKQVGKNPPRARPRAAAAAAARKPTPKDDSNVLPVHFKGRDVRNSGRVEVLEEVLGDEHAGGAADDEESGECEDRDALQDRSISELKALLVSSGVPDAKIQACTEKSDLIALLLSSGATSSENAILTALTRRLHDLLRAGTDGIASKRANYNSEVLTNLKTHVQDPTLSQGIRQAEKHAGDCSDRRDACDLHVVSCIRIPGLGCRLYGFGLAGEVAESGVLAAM
jgi:hypothetical protein